MAALSLLVEPGLAAACQGLLVWAGQARQAVEPQPAEPRRLAASGPGVRARALGEPQPAEPAKQAAVRERELQARPPGDLGLGAHKLQEMLERIA